MFPPKQLLSVVFVRAHDVVWEGGRTETHYDILYEGKAYDLPSLDLYRPLKDPQPGQTYDLLVDGWWWYAQSKKTPSESGDST